VPAATGGAPEAPAARSGGEAERKDPPESGAETRSPGGASGASERAPAAGEQPPGPVRPRPRSEQAQEARPAGNFVLQLSSFQSRAEADAFQAELRAAGWSSYVVQASVPGKGVWYRVRLGNYASWREAVEAKEKFERKQGKIAYVTRIGS
jgi:cell division septation protein DedD